MFDRSARGRRGGGLAAGIALQVCPLVSTEKLVLGRVDTIIDFTVILDQTQ